MKLGDLVFKLEHFKIDRECDDPSTIDCVIYIPGRKKTVCYPITSITVTSTYKNTRIVLNAEHETCEGRNCIKLDQLCDEITAIYKSFERKEQHGSIYARVKRYKSTPASCYTIPSWSSPILDMDQEAFFIKATNSFIPKD